MLRRGTLVAPQCSWESLEFCTRHLQLCADHVQAPSLHSSSITLIGTRLTSSRSSVHLITRLPSSALLVASQLHASGETPTGNLILPTGVGVMPAWGGMAGDGDAAAADSAEAAVSSPSVAFCAGGVAVVQPSPLLLAFRLTSTSSGTGLSPPAGG